MLSAGQDTGHVNVRRWRPYQGVFRCLKIRSCRSTRRPGCGTSPPDWLTARPNVRPLIAFSGPFAAVRVVRSLCTGIQVSAKRLFWSTWHGRRQLVAYLTAGGVQSEMEIAFAGLHQLCSPMLERVATIPDPQRDALQITFGMTAGPVPDPFMVGLGVLSLLSEVAAEQPLVCIVDDEQWLDRASAQILAFVARRLGEESVGLVFGARIPSPELTGLPELVIGGLPESDARSLLDSVLTVPVDAAVRDRIVAEAGGNPLALLEFPRDLTAEELAGGFALPHALPLSRSIEERFLRRTETVPPATRRLLLLASAEPAGDPRLVWQAAEHLGIDPSAAQPAAEAGLVEFGSRVRFRHPLVRSAIYWSALESDRREVHRALGDVTDPSVDPDRRAWHLAQAAEGPDEEVAGELERSAGRAQARGGFAAAAAFLDRATALTRDPALRAKRALDGAQAKVQVGAVDSALQLLGFAEIGPLNELELARVALVRAQLAFVSSRGNDAAPLLVEAAAKLASVDEDLAGATYLDALVAAQFAGRFAIAGGTLLNVARAAAGDATHRQSRPTASRPGGHVQPWLCPRFSDSAPSSEGEARDASGTGTAVALHGLHRRTDDVGSGYD